VGNKTFDFSRKKRIFCPKKSEFGPKMAFLVNLGQAMQAYLVPCWWVGWWLWRAGCISQDTYLLYHFYLCNYNTGSGGGKLAWASDHDLNTNPMNYYNTISIQI